MSYQYPMSGRSSISYDWASSCETRMDNKINCMDKYRLFDKIIKTKACGYFRAEHNDTRESVVVKRLNQLTTWEDLLRNKDLAIMKHSKVPNFPAIHEIVKDEDQFYVILGDMEKNLEFVIKGDIEKEDIFQLGRQVIKLAINLSEKSIYPREIRPVHLFTDSGYNTLKLAHLETIPKDLSKLDLVELQDLRYMSPEQVLTTREIDERSLVFSAGLLICDLVLGKSLINAKTKMNYMYELCRLFPQENIGSLEGTEHDLKPSQLTNVGDDFQKIIQKFNFSNEFVALLRQMLKIDRSERLEISELLDAWDVVVENERNHTSKENKLNEETDIQIKPNPEQFPIHDQIDLEIQFEFEQKPTLSILPIIKVTSGPLPGEKNVEDDASQPIIIKQSSAQVKHKKVIDASKKLNTTKDSMNFSKSRMTTNFKQPSLSTIRKPQLTNYAMNEANLGVQMGMNPSIFSENDV